MDTTQIVSHAAVHAGDGHEELSGPHPERADVFSTFEEDTGTRFMYIPGDILVASVDVERVKTILWEVGCEAKEEDKALGLQKWYTPRTDAVRYLVARCRSISARVLPTVSANVVATLGGHINPVCASPPEPAAAPDASIPYLSIPETPVGRGPGAGVRVGLIDSGVNELHPWVNARCERRVGHTDVEVASAKGIAVAGASLAGATSAGATVMDDAAGHGTFAAGLIIRRAPGVTVVARKEVVGGLISDWALAKALLDLGREDVDLVHLSLGGFTPENVGLPATERALLSLAQTNPDLVVVASAGNDGTDRPHFPAAFNGVVAVGALDKDGTASSFSNHGRWVDACTQGCEVVSTFFAGDLIAPMTNLSQHFGGWASWCGSSHAAAQVTGAIAAKMNPTGDPSRKGSARQAVFDLVTSAGPGEQVPGLGTRI